MHKTTVYLPEDVKRALGRVAAARAITEPSLFAKGDARPPPSLPLRHHATLVQVRETTSGGAC
jgi:hypothetical protein